MMPSQLWLGEYNTITGSKVRVFIFEDVGIKQTGGVCCCPAAREIKDHIDFWSLTHFGTKILDTSAPTALILAIF